MGYWGTLVALRTDGHLPVSLRDRDAEIRDEDRARRADRWQVASVSDNLVAEDQVLSELSAETGSPILAAYIADSDYGWLVGVTPSVKTWGAWLDARSAFAFERDHLIMMGQTPANARRRARQMIDGFGSPPAEAAKQAARWANEAGYRASAGAVRQILGSRRPPGLDAWLRLPWSRYAFAEEMFFALLDSLGVPRQRR
jgi:hypothetical protein